MLTLPKTLLPNRASTRRTFAVATFVALIVVLLHGASPASSSDNRGASVRWDQHTFTSATALSSYLSARGVDPDRFLAIHPGVAEAFGLTAIQWDDKAFYTLSGMKRWHQRAGTDFTRWGKEHPAALRALSTNAGPGALTLSQWCRERRCIAPKSTAAPAASGTGRVGLAITVSSGTWMPSAGLSYSYQWQRCSSTGTCAPIGGATSQTYTVQSADVSSTLRAVVTVRNRSSFNSATSNAVGPVAPPSNPPAGVSGGGGSAVAPPIAQSPSNAGATAVGPTPTGSTGTVAGTTTGAVAGASPANATAATSTPTPATSSAKFGIASGGGIEWASDVDLARELDGYKSVGAGWLRSDLKWSVVESTRGVFNWSTYDRLVTAATARGINIVFTLDYTPKWARPAGVPDDDKYAPADPNDFGPFVRAAVARFSPRGVKVFEIWNEPNLIDFWKPAPSAARYTALLKTAYANAKAADPSVTVLAGTFAPVGGHNDPTCGGSGATTNVNPINFLEQIYANGGRGFFDALSHHPYDTEGPTGTHRCNAWYQMFGTAPSLLSTMRAQGDGSKQIWATEFGTDLGWVGGSQTAQAQQVTDAFNLWRSYPWAGPLMVYSYRQNLAGFNLVNSDWSPRAAWYAYKDAAGP